MDFPQVTRIIPQLSMNSLFETFYINQINILSVQIWDKRSEVLYTEAAFPSKTNPFSYNDTKRYLTTFTAFSEYIC